MIQAKPVYIYFKRGKRHTISEKVARKLLMTRQFIMLLCSSVIVQESLPPCWLSSPSIEPIRHVFHWPPQYVHICLYEWMDRWMGVWMCAWMKKWLNKEAEIDIIQICRFCSTKRHCQCANTSNSRNVYSVTIRPRLADRYVSRWCQLPN